MKPLPRGVVLAALALITLVFAGIALSFAVQPGLASFADDSISYLIMAQVLSPWTEVSAAVRDIFPHEAYYPPLFPLLLAATGAAHDIARAHAVTVLLLAGSLPALYVLAFSWLQRHGEALAAVVVFALLPGVWLNSKGILSEPLFLMTTLTLLLCVQRRAHSAVLALLFAALTLTRTIGCVMAAAYIAWALLASGGVLRARIIASGPALAGLAAYGLWLLLRPAQVTDDYARIAGGDLAQIMTSTDFFALLGQRIALQAHALTDGWTASILIYWIETRPLARVLTLLLGLFAIAGWALRFWRREPDAWMFAAYAALLLIWPFPGQALRFLFPVLPMLLLYTLWCAREIGQRMGGSPLPSTVVVLIFVGLCAPALTFLYGRAQAGTAGGYSGITEWYGSADLKVARERAQAQLDLFATMNDVREHTAAENRVAWVAPAYIALLADRHAASLPPPSLTPEAYRQGLLASGATHALLSVYNPRETTSRAAWDAGMVALGPASQRIYWGQRADGGVYSVLVKLLAASD